MLLILALFFLVLAAHPFTTYPISLFLLKRFQKPKKLVFEDRKTPPTVVFLVTAYNEESVIVAKAENLLRLAATVPSCKIFIYVDAASDNTAALLEPYRDRMTIVVGETRRGKYYGLEILFKMTNSDILVFTDANVMLDEQALKVLCRHFEDPTVGCVSGHLVYYNGDESPTAFVGSAYWRFEEAIHQLESDTVGVIGVDGSLYAIRRKMHGPVPPGFMDDFYISMRILLSGYAVVRAPDALAMERAGSCERQEFRRKIRIGCEAFNVHKVLQHEIRHARPGILYAYVSHKLLKWLIAYNFALAALFAIAAAYSSFSALSVTLTLLTVLVLAGGAWLLKIPPSRQIGSALIAFTGTAVGVANSIRGKRYQAWDPITTARAKPDAACPAVPLTEDLPRQ
jgi:cellulose synthase/poly-beta-1,6-N-acetylglucosamine synthase-like glycosyltransferase